MPQTVRGASGLVPGLAKVAKEECVLLVPQGGLAERAFVSPGETPSPGSVAASGTKSDSEKLLSTGLGLLFLTAASRLSSSCFSALNLSRSSRASLSWFRFRRRSISS